MRDDKIKTLHIPILSVDEEHERIVDEQIRNADAEYWKVRALSAESDAPVYQKRIQQLASQRDYYDSRARDLSRLLLGPSATLTGERQEARATEQVSPTIYFRSGLAESAEMDAAGRYFPVIERRTLAERGSLVIPRYSALPYNRELCDELSDLGCQAINTYRQHCYVADIRNWYYDLGELTPRTWFALDQIPRDGGPFVLKGATNSRKQMWSTHMYAADATAATDVFCRLAEDSAIGTQPIYVRQYVPLRRLATGLHGLPISEEYRFFILDGKVLASGFYWSAHVDEMDWTYSSDDVPREFLQRVIAAVGDKIRFWVVDIARTSAGDWIVIELNDGQMSGLSEVNADDLYRELSAHLLRAAE